MLRELLTYAGHEVEVAGSGVEAIELGRTTRPDVVLSDIGLPGDVDGYAVARALRAELGDRTLILALTGYGQDSDQQRAFDAGFDQHLTKPADPIELERVISAGRAG